MHAGEYVADSGLYYLQSRYYDPETGRFINADGYVSTGQGILGNNMFAYCMNNPVNMIDETGFDPVPTWAKHIIDGTATDAEYAKALSANAGAWAGSAGYTVRRAILLAQEYKSNQTAASKVKDKQNMVPRKDARKGSQNRQKSGNRERNVAHPNGEEHSCVPKGNGNNRFVSVGVLLGASLAIIALVAEDAIGVGAANDVAIAPTAKIWWDAAVMVFG